MSYVTEFALEYRVIDETVGWCSHAKPDGASFCPTCGMPTDGRGALDAVATHIEITQRLTTLSTVGRRRVGMTARKTCLK